VTDAIEGRWLLVMGRPPSDPAGNEFMLAGGQVALAATGEPFGHYEVQPGQLVVTLPMPDIAEEGPWQIVVRLLLPGPLESVDRLPGTLESIKPDEPAFVAGTCALVRRRAEA
jgi:hypothetical protein